MTMLAIWLHGFWNLVGTWESIIVRVVLVSIVYECANGCCLVVGVASKLRDSTYVITFTSLKISA